jgi:hypothetical protein
LGVVKKPAILGEKISAWGGAGKGTITGISMHRMLRAAGTESQGAKKKLVHD